MSKVSLKRMSFSIEEELYDQLEVLLAQSGYENRSEFIRDMIRKQLTRKQCAGNLEVIGTISTICDLSFAGIETKLNEILDSSPLKVLGSSRFALPNHCATVMTTVTGIGDNIREAVNAIKKLKGTVQAEFVITSPAGASTKH